MSVLEQLHCQVREPPWVELSFLIYSIILSAILEMVWSSFKSSPVFCLIFSLVHDDVQNSVCSVMFSLLILMY